VDKKNKMMWSRIKSSFLADLNIIFYDNALLARCLAPFLLIILLRFAFSPLSLFIFTKTGFILDNYYSFIAITIILIIAIIPGIVNAYITMNERHYNILHVAELNPADNTRYLLSRMIINAFFSFVLVMITILMTKPVPTEGWLRTLFAGVMLSLQSPLVFLYMSSVEGNRVSLSAFSRLYWVVLIAAPVGLMLHHPWNYIAFFSPMYWVTWAWIVPSPLESLIYGSIALIITWVAIIVFFRKYMRTHTV
jgi:hypothetical protein